MRELFAWIDMVGWFIDVFSSRSRRDYTMILLLILFAVGCVSITMLWLRPHV